MKVGKGYQNGDVVICVKLPSTYYQDLTIGKKYEILNVRWAGSDEFIEYLIEDDWGYKKNFGRSFFLSKMDLRELKLKRVLGET